MPELTAEELKKKEEEEAAASLLAKEKATLATLKKEQEDLSTKVKPGELTDAQKLRIYEIQQKTVKEQGARLTATERELAELKAKGEEAAKPTMEESAKEFYADPVGTMKKAMSEMVAPLNAFKDRFESDSEYIGIKKRLMVNPVFAQHLNNPQFSGIIDELIAEGTKNGAQISEGMVEAAIKHTIGSVVTGDIVLTPVKGSEMESEKKGEETERESAFIPPYLQPSSPPHKETVKGKQYRDLTENEARLARERGQSKEEYLDWLEVPATEVIDSKIGLSAKKE